MRTFPAAYAFVVVACTVHSALAQNLLHNCTNLPAAHYTIELKRDVSLEFFATKAGIKPTEHFEFINALSAHLSQEETKALCYEHANHIVSITGPSVAYINAPVGPASGAAVTQTDAPWGLFRLKTKQRISSTLLMKMTEAKMDFAHDRDAGKGVDIYIVDTGVFVQHPDFGGRARWGGSFVSQDKEKNKLDTNDFGSGHGTHVAGIAAGTRWGVAKSANIIAVKVIGTPGNAASTDEPELVEGTETGSNSVIRAVEFILQEHQRSRRPSVVNMSLGYRTILPAVDSAVKKLIEAGIHVVVSAGNKGADAGNYSPGHITEVITVGAMTLSDKRHDASNWGPSVDIWAPGSNIWSAALNGKHRVTTGTSMAAPHVSGLVATLISRRGNMSPAAMAAEIRKLALPNVLNLGNIPGEFKKPNYLAHLPDRA